MHVPNTLIDSAPRIGLLLGVSVIPLFPDPAPGIPGDSTPWMDRVAIGTVPLCWPLSPPRPAAFMGCLLVAPPQQQRREKELRKQQEREQRRHYEEQLRREEERRRAEHEQVPRGPPHAALLRLASGVWGAFS